MSLITKHIGNTLNLSHTLSEGLHYWVTIIKYCLRMITLKSEVKSRSHLDRLINFTTENQLVTKYWQKIILFTKHCSVKFVCFVMIMGVAERKERHKEDLKKDILTAAKELFTQKGFEATSIRAIAEKIEYSPATIYLYYKDKNEIVHALHQDGFRLLVSHFEVLNTVTNPFERLKAMGRAYIQFAMQNPDIYQLLFVMKEPLEHVANCFEDWHEGDRAFDILLKTVGECQKIGYFIDLDKTMLSFSIWSTMHGMCTLRISGHLGHVAIARTNQVDLDHLISGAYETFVATLEKLKS